MHTFRVTVNGIEYDVPTSMLVLRKAQDFAGVSVFELELDSEVQLYDLNSKLLQFVQGAVIGYLSHIGVECSADDVAASWSFIDIPRILADFIGALVADVPAQSKNVTGTPRSSPGE